MPALERQRLFTRGAPQRQHTIRGASGRQELATIIPTVTIIEEAQSYLGRHLDESSLFVEWVKEGRKYDLGAILITQQPGSIAPELLSQADNWFCFHLLSEGDAGTRGKYNAHYSDDVLAHLIGEPIRGNCFMWSAPHQPFVLPVRVRSFEDLYTMNVNNDVGAPSVATQAQEIVRSMSGQLDRLTTALIPLLKENTTKFVRVPNAGVGIKSKQLYVLISKIRTAADTQSAEALKMPLLAHILGEGAVQRATHPATARITIAQMKSLGTAACPRRFALARIHDRQSRTTTSTDG